MNYKRQIATAFASITDPEEMEKFFDEVFTTKEVNDISMRWQVLKGIFEGDSQRNIAAKHGMSLCKITRGSKILKDEDAVSAKILRSGVAEK